MDLQFDKMNIYDFYAISNYLASDFDDFWTSSMLKQEIECKNSYFFVAKCENTIVGFAGIKVVFNEADLMNIVVKKSVRNQHIGSLLLENLLKFAKENNILSIMLEVNEKNIPAILLYKKYGFEQISVRKNYYNDGDAFIMKKFL